MRQAQIIEKKRLEQLYRRYNRREYVSPDPLECLYQYPDIRDREIVGLFASALAYGKAAQIVKSAQTLLAEMGRSPRRFLLEVGDSSLRKKFGGFRHRFTDCGDIIALARGARSAVSEHGSLNQCFVAGLRRSDDTVLSAVRDFARRLRAGAGPDPCRLVPDPDKGSACKRLNLFLRWMIRMDAVDPGGWEGVSPGKLIVPLDTHMARIGKMLGATSTVTADIRMALEMTAFFRRFAPDDPVKFDFALTRFGIKKGLKPEMLAETLCAPCRNQGQ